MADQATADPSAHKSIEDKLNELSPEEAEAFVMALELALRKRRWMLIGYFAALLAVVLGTALALYLWGTREPGTFVGWVFLIPPGVAGLVIWATGRYVKRIGIK